MKQHPWNSKILEACFAALCNMAANVKLHTTISGEGGGIDVLLAAMNLHRKDSNVQDYGSAALSNLTLGCPNNQQLMSKANGISATMKQNLDHARIQEESTCAVLGNVAS
jgi:hypothetical protein